MTLNQGSGSRAVPEGHLPNIGDPDVDPKRNFGYIGGVVRVSSAAPWTTFKLRSATSLSPIMNIEAAAKRFANNNRLLILLLLRLRRSRYTIVSALKRNLADELR